MRESDINRQLFNPGHYNIIAKQFRENFEHLGASDDPQTLGGWAALSTLMISLALRFQADNELFDPERFLTLCSPDPQAYPFPELWEGVMKGLENDD